jgi:lipopolysaccharide transport system ATP-binding protein
MDDVVLRAQSVGKMYDFGKRRGLIDLRERLSETVVAPFRSLTGKAGLRGSADVVKAWALKDVSFKVRRGEIVGIMGHNGSGKTTLMKILSRISEPTEGSAEIRGRVGTLLDVGAGLHGELTGRENVYLNAATHGMHKEEIRNNLEEIVAFAELEKFIDRPLKYFSSGMCLRLAFTIATFQRSSVLLVDEVLAQADPAFQAKCMDWMVASCARGQVILFVSHDLECMRKFCTRGMVFEKGRIAIDASIDQAVAYCAAASPGVQTGESWEDTMFMQG